MYQCMDPNANSPANIPIVQSGKKEHLYNRSMRTYEVFIQQKRRNYEDAIIQEDNPVPCYGVGSK